MQDARDSEESEGEDEGAGERSDADGSDDESGASEEEVVDTNRLHDLLTEHNAAEDAALAALVDVRRNRGKQRLQAQKEEARLRVRAAELLDIFLQRHSNHLVVPGCLFLNLLHAISELMSESAPVEEANSLLARFQAMYLKRVCRSKDVPKGEAITSMQDKMHDGFGHILDMVKQAPAKQAADFAALASEGMVYTVRVLSRNGALDVQVLTEAYEKALSDFMLSKASKFTARFFEDIINRYPELALRLLPAILRFTAATDAGGARSAFGRSEAFRLATLLLRQPGASALASKTAVACWKSLAATAQDASQGALCPR